MVGRRDNQVGREHHDWEGASSWVSGSIMMGKEEASGWGGSIMVGKWEHHGGEEEASGWGVNIMMGRKEHYDA